MSDNVRDIRDVLLGLNSSLVGTHLGDVCKRAADEIDRLRAKLSMLKESVEVQTVQPLRARISELEAEHNKQVCLRCMHAPGCFVTKEQINAAWEFNEDSSPETRAHGRAMLYSCFGIVACEECEGVGVGVSEHCTNCSGNGWVWRSDD